MIAIPLPNIGSMGGAYGHAQEVLFPALSVDPNRFFFVRCAQPILRRGPVTHEMLGGDGIACSASSAGRRGWVERSETRESQHDRSRSRRPQGSPLPELRRSSPSGPDGARRDNHSAGTGALAVHACRAQRSAGRPQRHTAELKPGSGMALPSHAQAVCRAVHADLSWHLASVSTTDTVSRHRNYFFANFFTVLF